tara:strand:- start:481 stop:657 length:177 start_codon:yes stop_codon:yes gene_type:complete
MLSRLQDGTAAAAKNVEPPSPYRKAEVKLSFFLYGFDTWDAETYFPAVDANRRFFMDN